LARSDFLELCADRWPSKLARLRDGFYTIKDENGEAVPFRLRPLQEKFLAEQHGFDLILKARQLGFTTVIQLDYLDDCLFVPNTAAGVIAHNREDAEAFFDNKIRFAYDNLPDEFKSAVPATQDSVRAMQFGNGSSIRVGTSLRSGTFQRLHVSEYGKLCAKFPDKAREVKSGALNTVHVGQKIRIESTAEGHSGHFHELCKKAMDRARLGTALTGLDFRMHFFGWYLDDKYHLAQDVGETSEQIDYFERLLKEHGLNLTRQQRAWYVKKEEQQGEDMKREFPSTPEEAFEASVEGAYFAKQMAKMRTEKRICRIPILDAPVDTSWDLGINDNMSITFWQTVGMERRAIDYYENSGEGWGHYAKVLGGKGYNYSRHYGPHDIEHRMLGITADTRRQKAEESGIKPWEVVGRIPDEMNGIDASRAFLAQVYIDEERCSRLIDCLDNYRKEWDDKLGVFKDHPRHDEYSHGYKSLETYAVGRPAAAASSSAAASDKMRKAYANRIRAVH
jgi:hypothetical protein